jgi:formylglycine-generating enzyme required for sulfatase activity
MRSMLRLFCSLSLLIASSASAVTMNWTFVGNAGNAADTTGFGAVGYDYNIGTYEVTNTQYTEFLNAVGATDINGIYNNGTSGILRSCTPNCTYTTVAARASQPANFVTFYDVLRFANWMHNGQPSGAQDNTTTEDGAYTITAQGIANNSITRNPGATIVLTSEDEWYKAAYHNAVGLTSSDYYDFPVGSNTQTVCSLPPGGTNNANCGLPDMTPVGSYINSDSPYGTFDQGGNVFEWNEAIIDGTFRGMRGGSHLLGPVNLAASTRALRGPSDSTVILGFRVAMIPEPGTGLLVIAGLLGLAGWRRASA